jgi:hypothetical protein
VLLASCTPGGNLAAYPAPAAANSAELGVPKFEFSEFEEFEELGYLGNPVEFASSAV